MSVLDELGSTLSNIPGAYKAVRNALGFGPRLRSGTSAGTGAYLRNSGNQPWESVPRGGGSSWMRGAQPTGAGAGLPSSGSPAMDLSTQGGSLVPARPGANGVGPGGGFPPPAIRPNSMPTSPGAPQVPGNGPINGSFSPAPGPLPGANTPRLPPPVTPQSGSLGGLGPAALGGAAIAGGAMLGQGAGGGGSPPPPQGSLPNQLGANDIGGLPAQLGGNNIGGGVPMPRPRPPVPMPMARPMQPPAPAPAPAAPAPAAQYQDPGQFNGLGIGPAGSGTADPSLQQLKQRFPWMFNG